LLIPGRNILTCPCPFAEAVVECLAKEPAFTGVDRWSLSGISVSSVQRIWRAHGLEPHRVRQFKLSNDKAFADKLRKIVGLYVDPPAQLSCCPSMRKARFKPSVALSPACR
jgi:hypothetical protein